MKEQILSVGIDIGTSTTQLIFSRLTIVNLASSYTVPRISIVDKEVIYRSSIYFTPLKSQTEIDAEKVREIIRKEYEKADEIAEKGLRLFPKDPAMYLLKVQIVSQSGQYEQVEKWAAKLSGMELDPQARTQLTVYRAEAFGRQENMTRMQEVLEEHYQKWKDPEVMYLLMMFYSGQKEYGRLKGLAGQLKEMDVKDSFRAAAQFAYAEAVEHMDGKEAAEELYQKMTKDFRKLTIANPTLYEVYIYRLLSHCAVGEYEKALELADYISNAKPGLSDGHLYRAYVLEKAGRGQEAKEERRKAQTAAPARQ